MYYYFFCQPHDTPCDKVGDAFLFFYFVFFLGLLLFSLNKCDNKQNMASGRKKVLLKVNPPRDIGERRKKSLS
jgi:hypothetical protein